MRILGGEGPRPALPHLNPPLLTNFIVTQLEIDTSEIKFHNVHRLMARRDRKPRNIIAKFVCNKDHENVKKLKVKPQFSINQQYPMEIADRRKELFPKMRALRAEGRHVKLVNDQLFVDREHVPLFITTLTTVHRHHLTPAPIYHLYKTFTVRGTTSGDCQRTICNC